MSSEYTQALEYVLFRNVLDRMEKEPSFRSHDLFVKTMCWIGNNMDMDHFGDMIKKLRDERAAMPPRPVRWELNGDRWIAKTISEAEAKDMFGLSLLEQEM